MEKPASLFSLLFRLSLWLRIIYGAFKSILGFALLGLIQLDVTGLFYSIMSNELIEDPNDPFIHFLAPIVDRVFSHLSTFVAAYLLFWGIIDIFLSINLLRRKLWAYKAALIVIAAFVLYELYRVSHTHSLILGFIIVVDIFVLWFIRREQMNIKAHDNELQ